MNRALFIFDIQNTGECCVCGEDAAWREVDDKYVRFICYNCIIKRVGELEYVGVK